ncbi:MAG: hypothetical protein ACPMAG_03730, partial [Limisphaerales bacterium]
SLSNPTFFSFNGAALFQARKWRNNLNFFASAKMLQWGRAFSSAEIPLIYLSDYHLFIFSNARPCALSLYSGILFFVFQALATFDFPFFPLFLNLFPINERFQYFFYHLTSRICFQ